MGNSFFPSCIYLYCFSVFCNFSMIWCHFWNVLKVIIIFFIYGVYYYFFLFLSCWKNLCMAHLDFELFYDIYNIINEHSQIQTPHVSLISLTKFDLERSYWKLSSIYSSALSLMIIYMLSILECIKCSLSMSLEEIKLIAIAI